MHKPLLSSDQVFLLHLNAHDQDFIIIGHTRNHTNHETTSPGEIVGLAKKDMFTLILHCSA